MGESLHFLKPPFSPSEDGVNTLTSRGWKLAVLWGLGSALSSLGFLGGGGGEWVASHPAVRTGRSRAPSAGLGHRAGTGVSKDAVSWLRSRGRRFALGPLPRLVLLRKCGEKARNQACQARGPSAPPSSPGLGCRKRAGGNALPGGGRGGERAGPPAPQLPRPAGAELSLRQTRPRPLPLPRPPPPARRRSGCRLPLALQASAAARPPGAERAAESHGRHRPPHGAHAAGAGLGGRLAQPSLLGGEMLKPEGLSVSGPRSWRENDRARIRLLVCFDSKVCALSLSSWSRFLSDSGAGGGGGVLFLWKLKNRRSESGGY